MIKRIRIPLIDIRSQKDLLLKHHLNKNNKKGVKIYLFQCSPIEIGELATRTSGWISTILRTS